jgi:hypothetical protein
MESLILCKDVKQKYQICLNSSHSNPTKTTSGREELEMKNKGGNQQMTTRSISNGFLSLRG